MKLHYSATSPFVRKVLVCAREKDLVTRIEHVNEEDVANANPLGKVPTLVTDDGTALYDSLVICDYLDTLTGPPSLIPSDPTQRTRVLSLHALADGIMEAGVACVGESRRPQDKQWEVFTENQRGKIERAIDELESHCVNFGTTVDLGTITAGAALGYIDFRLPDVAWSTSHANLAAWYATFSQRDSMAATAPPG